MFELSQYPLNYKKNSLEPYISEKTMEFHYEKHMATYIENLNKAIQGTSFMNSGLKQIIIKSSHSKENRYIFNNSAQVFNHNFFFNCLKVGVPQNLPKKLLNTFDSIDDFKTQFKAVANTVFGSGWVWLVTEAREYKIVKTSNGDTPLAHNQTPLLCLDLWEHAYYLDYQNRRGEFVDNFLNHLINWEFVESCL
ncbi:MAG: superoxide dismutase [Alphaproteobacteria bacterium]|nr:superoxide dismutase [Alphaproteobacteria bacterium]